MSRIRPVDLARASVGLLDLIGSRQIASVELGHRAGVAESNIARFLGARQVAQATVNAVRGYRVAGIVVDGLHLASMSGLALLGPASLRRPAIIQAFAAIVFILWGVATLPTVSACRR